MEIQSGGGGDVYLRNGLMNVIIRFFFLLKDNLYTEICLFLY